MYTYLEDYLNTHLIAVGLCLNFDLYVHRGRIFKGIP